MTWTKSGEGTRNNPLYRVYTETLNPVSTSQDDGWSSVIDFVPPGTDFTVIANSSGANLSQSAHVELFVGYERTAPNPVSGTALLRYRSYKTPFIRVTSEIDQASVVLHRDVSTHGQFPYYWLKLVGDIMAAGTANADVILKVFVGRGSTEVV